MMTLSLDQNEEQVLQQVMEHALETVELEIRHTDHAEFKELLKQRRDLINNILAKLEVSAPALS